MKAIGENVGTARKKPSVLSALKTVLLAFFGVRKRAGHEQETLNLRPQHLVLAGLIGAFLFVTSLVMLVKFILSRASG